MMTMTIKKRKQSPVRSDGQHQAQEHDLEPEEMDSKLEKIEVDLEFDDLDAIDYHAIKHLIAQLFLTLKNHPDSTGTRPSTHPSSTTTTTTTLPTSIPSYHQSLDHFDVGQLTDLVLGDQKEWVGCTVKCDEDHHLSDPYAFISVLDLRAYRSNPSILGLTNHLRSILTTTSSSSSTSLQTPDDPSARTAQELLELFDDALRAQGRGIGLVLSERLINMPVQIIPHLFTQLGQEIKHAQSKSAPGFEFDLLLIPSRVFLIPSDQLDQAFDHQDVNPSFNPVTREDQPKPKRPKSGQHLDLDDTNQIGLYHPEDQIISQFASHTLHYSLTSNHRGPDRIKTGEEFGVEQRGRLMLVELSKWDEMVQSLHAFIGSHAP